MFDPTAYENIKVVLEGLIYDFDLQGEIVVIERNDLVNLADFSRTFNLSFSFHEDKKQTFIGKIEIHSTFKQIISEWTLINEIPGSELKLQFIINKPLNEILEKRIHKYLRTKFGNDFEVEWVKEMYSNQAIVYHFQLRKYDFLTEQTIDLLSEDIEIMMSAYEDIFEMLKSFNM